MAIIKSGGLGFSFKGEIFEETVKTVLKLAEKLP